jgi:spermidine synthase
MKHITLSSALLYTIVASILSFLSGRATRVYIFSHSSSGVTDKSANVEGLPQVRPASAGRGDKKMNKKKPMIPKKNADLPTPRLVQGKKVPKTKYTSMIFSEVHVVSDKYSSLHLDDVVSTRRRGEEEEEEEVKNASDNARLLDSYEEEVCVETFDGHAKCSLENDFHQEDEDAFAPTTPPTSADKDALDGDDDDDEETEEENEDDGEEEVHLPAGQHLLVDIKRVNSDFLNSEVRLAEAMLNVVHESKLTLLSYHCHKLIPMGVSCVGVLLESHISFHTWPEAGVLTLDLFTCGNGDLIPVLPVIERLFAVPMDGVGDDSDVMLKPHTVWTHKLRGFRDVENHLSADLGEMVLEASSYDLKKEIASVQTAFQRIDIYDTIHKGDQDIAAFERSLVPDGSYESQHPQFFEPNRLVFLDGILQSMREGNEAYHEALVHPAMFYHPDPKRVAIIGGGEGSTLREVLKHDTVEHVIMIEIDEVVVNVSREYLPDWNDCSDLEGSAKWCGDDERAEMKYVDAFAWFNDRFTVQNGVQVDPFDVLIMDALYV